MDFAVSERLQTILEMIQEFIEKELIPREAQFAVMDFSEMEPEIEDLRKMVRQMELWAPLHPKEYGGVFAFSSLQNLYVSSGLRIPRVSGNRNLLIFSFFKESIK